MCNYHEPNRHEVYQGLPACLTDVGITTVFFRPGTSYHDQQAALVKLSQLSRKDGFVGDDGSWVEGKKVPETDCL